MTDNATPENPANEQTLSEQAIPAAADTSSTESLSPRADVALKLVKSYLPWSAGAGIIPLPGVDLTALLAVQVRMLSKLAALYDVPFREQAAKSVVASLIGTVAGSSVAGGIASTFKAIPVIGTLIGITVLPALGAAVTYAVGKVFITHFESGGTFLDLDPAKVEAHFRAEFAKAKADPATAPSDKAA